jgi:serine/threonine-protein kinase
VDDNLLELHRRIAEGLIRALADEGALPTEGMTEQRAPTENPEAFAEYAQARAFLERPDVPQNLDHAIRLFQSAIAKDPKFALAYAGLAETFWAQYQETNDPGWTAKAMAANVEALRIDSSQAEVLMSLAVMYGGQGRSDQAIVELQRVMTLQPQSDNPHRVLSEVYVDRSQWDKAIGAANEAVKLRPSYWRNHRQLGYAYFRAGRFADAIHAWERVVQLQPDSARGYQNLGTAFQAAGRHRAAMDTYEKAISIRPSARSYSNLGTLYFWNRDYNKAAEVFEKAVALAPKDSGMHANLGDACMKLGQSARAKQKYRDAVQLVKAQLQVNPRDSQLLASLALYRAKLGERRAAAEELQKAIQISANDGNVLYVAALVRTLAGDHETACTAVGQALDNGAIEEEIRHADELSPLKACAVYDRVVATHPREG